MDKATRKEVIRWVVIAVLGLGGGTHLNGVKEEIKEYTDLLYAPIIEETTRIRVDLHKIEYSLMMIQHLLDNKTMDEALELTNEHFY